jgi:hypothetical protein
MPADQPFVEVVIPDGLKPKRFQSVKEWHKDTPIFHCFSVSTTVAFSR